MNIRRGKLVRIPARGEKLFAVTLLFRSHVGSTESLRPLCEERVVVFSAATPAEASVAARRYGRGEEHSYKNSSGELVQWTFVRVLGAQDIGPRPPIGGWEVASRFVRRRLATLRPQGPRVT